MSPNVNPFFLKAIEGNIRMCQGCRSSLRNRDGSLPLPPYDFAIARFERRTYRDKGGILQTPQREQSVHYHFLCESCQSRVRGIKFGDETNSTSLGISAACVWTVSIALLFRFDYFLFLTAYFRPTS